jgi:carbon monoxide dehydrogenase subunit G
MSDAQELRIAARCEIVWSGLHDVEVLRRCLPNCEQLEWQSEHRLGATFRVGLGPLRARLHGTIELSHIEPLRHYTLSGRFEGAIAGFAEGACEVQLSPDGAGTLLRYEIRSSLGGKLARVASKLTEGSALKLAERFFGAFARIMAERGTPD